MKKLEIALIVLSSFLQLKASDSISICHMPRPGDTVSVTEVSAESVLSDSLCFNIDLSHSQLLNEKIIRYRTPAESDSVASLVRISSERNARRLISDKGGLMVLEETKPGQIMRYTLPVPEFVCKDTVSQYDGSGRFGSLTETKTSGLWRHCFTSGLKIITPECDSLENIICSELHLDGIFSLGKGLSTISYRHRTVRKRWYSTGLRYPVLEMSRHILTVGDSIADQDCRWFYFPENTQLAQLTDDPENEETWKNAVWHWSEKTGGGNFQLPDSPQNPNPDTDSDRHVAVCFEWKNAEQSAEVTITSDSFKNVGIFLYEQDGKLLDFTRQDVEGTKKYSFDMSDRLSGMYLILVESDEDSRTPFKFVKP